MGENEAVWYLVKKWLWRALTVWMASSLFVVFFSEAKEENHYTDCQKDSDCKLIKVRCSDIMAVPKVPRPRPKELFKAYGVPGCMNPPSDDSVEYYNPICVKQECVAKSINSKRKNDVPAELLSACGAEIADRHEPYNFSDVVDSRPNTRLNLACHYKDDSWYIYCEKGGYVIQHLQFKFTKDGSGKWSKESLLNSKSPPLEECPEK